MKEIVVPANNSVYQTLIIICPIALFFGGRMLYRDFYGASPRWWLIVLLSIGVLLCLYFLITSFNKIRNGQSAMRINKLGIEDNVSMAKPGLIKWDNIRGSKLVHYTGSEHLVIYLKNADPILRPLSFFKNKMAQQMIEDIESPIAINPKLIRYDVKKLVEVINKRAKRK